jgi:hypothetical protein
VSSKRHRLKPTSTCRNCGKPLLETRNGHPSARCANCRRNGVREPIDDSVDSDTARLSRALHEGMYEHGFSLRSLARELGRLGAPVSLGALTDWVRGRSVPADPLNSSSLRGAEILLNRQIGDLSMELSLPEPPPEPPSRRPARSLTDYVGGAVESRSLSAESKDLDNLIKKITGSQRVLVVEVTTDCLIDVARRFSSATHTLVVRAMADDADNYWHRHTYTAQGTPTITANEGCSLARQRRRNQGVEAVELVFPKLLKKGERHRFSFTVHYPPDENEATYYARAFHSPLAAATLNLLFEAPPRELYECRWNLTDLQEGGEIDRVRIDARPGRARLELKPPLVGARGWRWTW